MAFNKATIINYLQEFVQHLSTDNEKAAAFTEGLLRGELERTDLPEVVVNRIVTITNQIRETKDFNTAERKWICNGTE